jgi:phospholipid/cholesterol/gamma-HCH transport system substrate-binding protein
MSMRERNQFQVGVIGLVVVIALIAAAINFDKLRSLLDDTSYEAELAETGGLQKGDDIRVSGVKVGAVESVDLAEDHVVVGFAAHGLHIGGKTTATVKSDNALGRKFLAINPGGEGDEKVIPLDRTDSGYAVTTALGDLTSATSRIDVHQMSASFDALSEVLERTPNEFRSTLTGVSALSRTISSRDAELRELFRHASSLSSVLAQRNEEITSILGNGSLLFAELERRREVIGSLLKNVVATTDQLRGFVAENKSSLHHALSELKGVATLLKKYRGTIEYALTNLNAFVSGLGEAVGSGPFFQAYVQNMTAPTSLAPILSGIVDGEG